MKLTGFSIDLREITDQGKVLLVNLRQSKNLSHEAARTFGALLVNEFFESSIQRQTSPGRDPKPYYLYLDEFQNFVSLDIVRMLAEVRKFGLFLVLAHQYFEQLDEEIVAGALNNCQIKTVFGGLSTTNARLMAEELFIGKLDPMKVKASIYQTKFWPEYRRDKVYGKGTSSGTSHGSSSASDAASFPVRPAVKVSTCQTVGRAPLLKASPRATAKVPAPQTAPVAATVTASPTRQVSPRPTSRSFFRCHSPSFLASNITL